MAALAGQRVRNEGIAGMTQNALQPITPPVERSRKPPVRVKVRHQPPQRGKMYPPDGERKRWWEALKSALGTASAPRGPRNGNYSDGHWTAEAIEERRWLRSLVREFGTKGLPE
jgi:hypothetical protein